MILVKQHGYYFQKIVNNALPRLKKVQPKNDMSL